MTIYLLTINGPNKDNPEFYQTIDMLLQKYDTTYCIICGDLNLVLNTQIDTYKNKNGNNPKGRETVLCFIESHNVLDMYRHQHPQTKHYSWHKEIQLDKQG